MTNLTLVATWAGVAYVYVVIDAFSRTIVGLRVASHMLTSTVTDAIEMARSAHGALLTRLWCHSDAGSLLTSLRRRALGRDRRRSLDRHRR